MTVVLVTGSGGLVGSAVVEKFAHNGCTVVGIDNDIRGTLFGEAGSVMWNIRRLAVEWADRYRHIHIDIRRFCDVDSLFHSYGESVGLVVHAAGQPSHDWSAGRPVEDFNINAVGTVNVLEAARRHCPDAVFVYTSTNKVYGDTPNYLPFIETDTRWIVDPRHRYNEGIDEDMTIDRSAHSPFGVSKLAGDLMVQEYGRYYGMKTVCLRCGCITGPCHRGVQLHGFLAYLMKCCATGTPYTVFGYKGKQVRDNLHVVDLVEAIWEFFMRPVPGAVYNMGGGLASNCSILEAIAICQEIVSRELTHAVCDDARKGDHTWWISDTRRFKLSHPAWGVVYDTVDILQQIYEAHQDEWA
jgi:CDP-paratose 2-epimerase